MAINTHQKLHTEQKAGNTATSKSNVLDEAVYDNALGGFKFEVKHQLSGELPMGVQIKRVTINTQGGIIKLYNFGNMIRGDSNFSKPTMLKLLLR